MSRCSVFGCIGATTLAAILILAPYFIRNTIWTGNPVFPFAAGALGQGHWSDDNVERWRAAHQRKSLGDGFTALGRQWLFSAGYGAPGGGERAERSVTDIARFEREGGVPLLFLLALAGAVVGWRAQTTRNLTAAMLVILAIQLVFWLLATHHQSRFLMPTLIPISVLAALALGRLQQWGKPNRPWLTPLIAGGVMLVFTVQCFETYLSQTVMLRAFDGKKWHLIRAQPWQIIDSLIDRADVTVNQPGRVAGMHPLNQLPPGSRTLMVCDAGALLYIDRPVTYNTPFDPDLLAGLIRQYNGDIHKITIALVHQGYTHVWFSRGEFDRLSADGSYGVDPSLTLDKLEELFRLWLRLRPNQPRAVNQPQLLAPLPQFQQAPAQP